MLKKTTTFSDVGVHARPSELKLALFSVGELYGGVEQFVFTYALYLKKNTSISVVVLLLNKGVLFEKLEEAGIQVLLIHQKHKYDLSCLGQIANTLKERNIQILHTHGYKATILGTLAAKRAKGVKVVKTEHGALEPQKGIKALAMRLNDWLDQRVTSRLVDRLVYITHDLKEKKKVAFPRSTTVIHNGIPPFSHEVLSQRAIQKGGAFLMGIFGRLAPIKGHRVLFDALLKMKSERPKQVLVLGNGPLEDELKEAAHSLGVAPLIRFAGFQTSVYEFMSRLDCLVMPSYDEGLPYTLLEAMHLKVPIVASCVGGMKEILVHRQTALLFPPGNSWELAMSLDELAQNQNLVQRIAEEAYRTALQSFDIKQMSENYMRLYFDLVGAL